jgi:hypothetical protein
VEGREVVTVVVLISIPGGVGRRSFHLRLLRREYLLVGPWWAILR